LDTIPLGENYWWGCELTPTESGTYRRDDNDSLLFLTVVRYDSVCYDASGAYSLVLGGDTIKNVAPGTLYLKVLISSSGRDSLLYAKLFVRTMDTVTIKDSVCYGREYHLYNFTIIGAIKDSVCYNVDKNK
jgi:hypothetical protein